jgi:hypothetical protein
MIGEGRFRAEVARGFALLEELNLSIYMNPRPAIDPATIDNLRSSETYVDEYSRHLSLQAFDFLLDDGSLFFFRRDLQDQTQLSYGYLESPYAAISYGEFLDEYYGAGSQRSMEAWPEYEEYRAQALQRPNVLPVRYDWSPGLYREGAHPAAHLHVGYRTGARLALDAVLTPLQFVLLAIRQFYLQDWEATVSHHADAVSAARAITDLEIVPAYRKGRDLHELRLVAVTGRPPVATNRGKLPGVIGVPVAARARRRR